MLINIFEESVFDDTSYTICAVQFDLKTDSVQNNIRIIVYPSKIEINTVLCDDNNYMIGGDIYNMKLKNTYKISRLTSKNIDKKNTNIIVKCIDDNSSSQIGLSYVSHSDIYVDDTPNQTARTYATLVIEPAIDENKQKELVIKFNRFLDESRKKYNSLFLTNYRESKDIARKRISFDLVYLIVGYLLEN